MIDKKIKFNNKIICYQSGRRFLYFDNLKDKITVLVGGCFDVLHYGHFKFLKQAKENGDHLTVLLESDEFIKTHKKKQPIHNEQQRAHMLAALEFVDFVIVLPLFSCDEQYAQIIKEIQPKIIALTSDDLKYQQKKQQAKSVDAKLIVIKQERSFSCSNLINYETISCDRYSKTH